MASRSSARSMERGVPHVAPSPGPFSGGVYGTGVTLAGLVLA
ncbi:MAG: hypothetical protein M0008_07420 [Actinomycetota bacterium]|nr:hypothetical protein [Actinomycetota bacterium]